MKRERLEEKKKKRKSSAGGRAKRIGSAYERTIARSLSMWVSNFKRSDIFWRTALSGGVGRKMLSKPQLGDVGLIDPLGAELINTFVIECKWRKKHQIHNLVYSDTAEWAGFWKDVSQLAKEHHKLPLMFCHERSKKDLVVVNEKGWRLLQKVYKDLKPRAIFPHFGMHIIFLEKFLCLDYSKLKREIKKSYRERL